MTNPILPGRAANSAQIKSAQNHVDASSVARSSSANLGHIHKSHSVPGPQAISHGGSMHNAGSSDHLSEIFGLPAHRAHQVVDAENQRLEISQGDLEAVKGLLALASNHVALINPEVNLLDQLTRGLSDSDEGAQVCAADQLASLAWDEGNRDVFSRPSLKSLVTGLISKLQSKNADMQLAATKAVAGIFINHYQDFDFNLENVSVLMDGLSNNLDSKDDLIKQFAARALSALALQEDTALKYAIKANSKLLIELIKNLQSSNPSVKVSVAAALGNLSIDHENHVALMNPEVGLLDQLISGLIDSDDDTQLFVVGALSSLAWSEGNRDGFFAANLKSLVTGLISKLESNDPDIQRAATTALACICDHTDATSKLSLVLSLTDFKNLIFGLFAKLQSENVLIKHCAAKALTAFAAGKLPAFISAINYEPTLLNGLINTLGSKDPLLKCNAAVALGILALDRDNHVALMNPKVNLLKQLTSGLSHIDDDKTQLHFLVMLSSLALNEGNRDGFYRDVFLTDSHKPLVTGLIDRLESKDADMQLAATKALACLVNLHNNKPYLKATFVRLDYELKKMLKSDDADIKGYAQFALVLLNPASSVSDSDRDKKRLKQS